MAPENSYIIVGAGVFGVSTAYHLIKQNPDADIRLIDRTPFPCQNGASWDWSKIIRTDYAHELYMKKALEAQQVWRNDPLFNQFYHQSGLVMLGNTDLSKKIIENYKKLKVDVPARLSSVDEVKRLWNGVFADADFTGINQAFINENGGWADAAKALKGVIEFVIKAGVNYSPAEVISLEFNIEGAATGIRTVTGEIYSAKNIILATGANTGKLIADSAPNRPELQIGDRMIATGVCNAMVNLSPEEAKRFSLCPVFVNGTPTTIGCGIPPNKDGMMKIFRDTSFKNLIQHSSGELISMPPSLPDYGQWDVSQIMKKEVGETARGFFGANADTFDLQNYRICWDGYTPTQDFIIAPHPHCKNLYLATGGSFHGWKFFPIIGKYVVQMIEGSLDAELAEAWAWDRKRDEGVHSKLTPRRELRDIL